MRFLTLADIEKKNKPGKEELVEPKREASERQITSPPKRWWEKESIRYAFSDPHVKARLEKLMGSNMVLLTDRMYMQKLSERILTDYALDIEIRVAVRKAAEEERVKNLVLSGKIPFENAPPEMADHPVMLIEEFCNKLIAERRAKIKHITVHIPKFLYWDDTPDPPSGLGIEKGHWFRANDPPLCKSPGRFVDMTDEEEIQNKYMFTEDEYDALKYIDDAVIEMNECETIEEMYDVADDAIGEIKTIC